MADERILVGENGPGMRKPGIADQCHALLLEGYCPRCGDLIAAADQAPADPLAPPTCAACGGLLGSPIVVRRRAAHG